MFKGKSVIIISDFSESKDCIPYAGFCFAIKFRGVDWSSASAKNVALAFRWSLVGCYFLPGFCVAMLHVPFPQYFFGLLFLRWGQGLWGAFYLFFFLYVFFFLGGGGILI